MVSAHLVYTEYPDKGIGIESCGRMMCFLLLTCGFVRILTRIVRLYMINLQTSNWWGMPFVFKCLLIGESFFLINGHAAPNVGNMYLVLNHQSMRYRLCIYLHPWSVLSTKFLARDCCYVYRMECFVHPFYECVVSIVNYQWGTSMSNTIMYVCFQSETVWFYHYMHQSSLTCQWFAVFMSARS